MIGLSLFSVWSLPYLESFTRLHWPIMSGFWCGFLFALIRSRRLI